MKALNTTEVPVPAMHCLCEDTSVIGAAFYVMSFVEGRIFWDPALPELDPRDRKSLYDDMNRVVAALHRVDVNAVGLGDYGKPGNFLQRLRRSKFFSHQRPVRSNRHEVWAAFRHKRRRFRVGH